MNTVRILGITVFAIGVILLIVGYNASDAPVDQLADTFTGRYTDRTMRYLITGAAAVLGGGLFAVFGKRT
jgi:drug/metabolite transporter (DMT)-like permease